MNISVNPKARPDPVLLLGAHHCKWPIGDPQAPDFRFCTMLTVEGEVYCFDHCERAYPNWREKQRA